MYYCRIFALILFIIYFSCGENISLNKTKPVDYVEKELGKLAPVEITFPADKLPESEKACLEKLIQAGKLIDTLFFMQVSTDNIKLLQVLGKSQLEEDKQYKKLFKVMFGPWNRIDEEKPFLTAQEKPQGAGFYPPCFTKEELEKKINESPDKEKLIGTFTIVKKNQDRLEAVPYHEYYHDYVVRVNSLLKEAAELTSNENLKKYLELRAEGFLTDDYFESDMAWMDLDGELEIVIGPYEVYEDKMFNYKAAYEAFLCVVDQEESAKLAEVGNYLDELENHLPLPDEHKNFNRGKFSPIKVVHEVFSAGDTKAGVQTTAFNLPNDERVREAKGSKKVMLKNIARAKFEKCWIPIVNEVLAPEALEAVSFDAYFNHVLMHEVSHGIGPGNITLADGTETSVSKELKELYSYIEECKADVLGIYNLFFLIEKGVFPEDLKHSAYRSYLGGMFRSIRFGIEEAHGGGVAIQFNYLFEKGAFYLDENEKMNVNEEIFDSAIKELAAEILIIQAEGNYQGAKEMMEKYSILTPVLEKLLAQLEGIPIDIRPEFSVLK